jgi:hypothetical protein
LTPEIDIEEVSVTSIGMNRAPPPDYDAFLENVEPEIVSDFGSYDRIAPATRPMFPENVEPLISIVAKERCRP